MKNPRPPVWFPFATVLLLSGPVAWAAESPMAGWEYTDKAKDKAMDALLDRADQQGLPILVGVFSSDSCNCPHTRARDLASAAVRVPAGLPRLRTLGNSWEHTHAMANAPAKTLCRTACHPRILRLINARPEELAVCRPWGDMTRSPVLIFTAEGHLVGFYDADCAAKRGDAAVAGAKEICAWYAKSKAAIGKGDALVKEGGIKAAFAAIQKVAAEDDKFSLQRMTSLFGKAPGDKDPKAAIRFHPGLVQQKTKEYQEAATGLVAQAKEQLKDPKTVGKAKATLAKVAEGPADWPQVAEAKTLLQGVK